MSNRSFAGWWHVGLKSTGRLARLETLIVAHPHPHPLPIVSSSNCCLFSPTLIPRCDGLASLCHASDFVIDGQWGGRQGRERPRTSHVALTVAPRPNYSNEDGEFWWNRAVNRYSGNGVALANAQTVPWKALCTYSLSEYFLEVLGEHGRERPLVVSE